MAQEDFIFTDKAQYKPATVEVGFNPVQAADVTPLMEKNRDILSENFRRHQEAEEKNIERENEAQKLADDANVQRLAEFSDKLVGLIQTGIDKQVKHETAELEIWALNNKEELLKSYENRNKLEAEALNGQRLVNDLTADAQNKGASTDVIKKLRGLGGWRKVAVTRVLLQKAGINYATYRSSAEVKEIKLPRVDKSKPKINGKYQPLLNAEGAPVFYNIITAGDEGDTAEKAAIIKEIEKQYVGKYAGMGTLADRHELMYSKIQEHEEAIRAADALDAQQRDADAQKENLNNQILMAANHSPEQFGKKLQELTILHAGTFGDGKGTSYAAENFVTAFAKAVTDGLIPPETAARILEKTRIVDKSRQGEAVSLEKHAMFGPLVKKLNIGAVIEARRKKDHEKFTLKLQNDADDLKKEMLTKRVPEMMKEKGYITKADILTLEAAWLEDPRGGKAGQPFPLANLGTIQDQDDNAAKKLAEKMKEANGGYLTELQATRLPMHIAKLYREAGVVRDDLEPDSTQMSAASSRALQIATDHFKIDNPAALTTTQGKFIQRAEAAYKKEFARLSLLVGKDKAHTGALEHIEKNSKQYALEPPTGSSTAYVQKTVDVGNALKNNKDVNGKTDFTVKIPGLEHEIEQIKQIATLGDGQLPAIFFNATRDYRMPGGQNAAWALARAQYKAYTGEDLFAPDGVTLVTPKGKKLNVDQNQNINYKNTNAKTNRVILETGNNGDGEGEGGEGDSDQNVDASTMTQNDFLGIIEGPFKDKPYAAYFQNKANAPDGKKFTLDDVVYMKGTDSKYRTAGQYGLSAKQITDYANHKGLDLNTTEFNLETEREIFVHHLTKKLKNNNNKYAGLVSRFPALDALTPAQLKQWDDLVSSENNSYVPSVYNNPEVTTHGLIQLKGA